MASNNYRLYELFDAPTEFGSVRAIAVPYALGKFLQSFYGIMLQLIVLELWAFIVLLGLAWSLSRKKHIHSHDVVVWNLQASPLAVARNLLVDGPKATSLAILWISIAVLAAIGAVALGSAVSPYLVVTQDGNAFAPVNEATIYVPEKVGNVTTSPSPEVQYAGQYAWSTLTAPGAYRAVSALDAVDPSTGQLVSLDDVSKHIKFSNDKYTVPEQESQGAWISWEYSLNGYDFGMQKAPSLRHSVRGYCNTEFAWLQINVSNTTSSQYRWKFSPAANDSTTRVTSELSTFRLSIVPGARETQDPSNVTFALVPGTMGRVSFVRSFDPWYLSSNSTRDQAVGARAVITPVYDVLPGRPALSCWQQDTWTHGKIVVPASNLENITALSPAIRKILEGSLITPRVTTLGQALAPIPLKSSMSMAGPFFDGATASVTEDVKRLVRGAYIATRDALQESTFIGSSSSAYIRNGIINGTTLDLLPGANEFVIRGRDFMTLRLNMLAIVPAILIAMHVIALIIGSSSKIPWPWQDVHGMDASHLFQKIIENPEHNGGSEIGATDSADKTEQPTVFVRPKWDKRTSSFSWHRYSSQVEIASPTELSPMVDSSVDGDNDAGITPLGARLDADGSTVRPDAHRRTRSSEQ